MKNRNAVPTCQSPGHCGVRSSPAPRPGFTLIELLVVMGIILIVTTVVVVSARGIFREVRLASASNTISAALGLARGEAMKSGRPTLVAFYPRVVSENDQRIEIIIAQWTRDTDEITVAYGAPYGNRLELSDRFRPVPGIAIRLLPRGINIGGPNFVFNFEGAPNPQSRWFVTSNLLQPFEVEAAGPVLGVMFGPDGTLWTENRVSDADHVWIDFDGDGLQNRFAQGTTFRDWYMMFDRDDEVNVLLVPYLAVFDEEKAREQFDTDTWDSETQRFNDLTLFITEFADRFHFNRYTGVPMP